MDKTITKILGEPEYRPEYKLYFLSVEFEKDNKKFGGMVAGREKHKLISFKPGDKI